MLGPENGWGNEASRPLHTPAGPDRHGTLQLPQFFLCSLDAAGLDWQSYFDDQETPSVEEQASRAIALQSRPEYIEPTLRQPIPRSGGSDALTDRLTIDAHGEERVDLADSAI